MSTALILHDVQTLSHMVVAVWVPEKRFLTTRSGVFACQRALFSNWALTTGNGFVYDKLRFPDTANNHCEETRTAN